MKIQGVRKLTDKFSPIGLVHCELKELKDAALHWKNSDVEGEIEAFEEFGDGLIGIERCQHLAIIFLFHNAAPFYIYTYNWYTMRIGFEF